MQHARRVNEAGARVRAAPRGLLREVACGEVRGTIHGSGAVEAVGGAGTSGGVRRPCRVGLWIGARIS